MNKLKIFALVQETPKGTVDLQAVEAAKALLPGEITAISLNEEKALRFALSAGCSQAVLIQAEKEMSAYYQAEAYYDFLREQKFDLVLASAYQAGWESLNTKMILMERLQLPSLHFVQCVIREGERIEAIQKITNRNTRFSVSLPAGISVSDFERKGPVNLNLLLQAYKVPLEVYKVKKRNGPDFLKVGSVRVSEDETAKCVKLAPKDAAEWILKEIRRVIK